jgi:hypothetical protein
MAEGAGAGGPLPLCSIAGALVGPRMGAGRGGPGGGSPCLVWAVGFYVFLGLEILGRRFFNLKP